MVMPKAIGRGGLVRKGAKTYPVIDLRCRRGTRGVPQKGQKEMRIR